jgi:two-component system KDP operon response regulator KdpE
VRVLIVDDEKAIRRFLKASLISRGHDVFESATGTDALERSITSHPDVMILDLGLPDMDGVRVIREIRKRAKTPIIVLSVRDDVSDKVLALNAGADDYLTKPFSITELVARLQAVIRRLIPMEQEEVLRVGKLNMDAGKREVSVNGKQADLTPTEYDILRLLMVNAGKVVTHEQILREVWGKTEDMAGVFHLLRVTISNLRSKIEPDPDRPTHVLTEPGIGYRLRPDS